MGKKSRLTSILIVVFAFVLCVSGCSRGVSDIEQSEESTENKVLQNLEGREKDISPQLSYEGSMELSYAEAFAVDYYAEGYQLLTVADGSRYLIVPEDGTVPQELDDDIVVLMRPIENLYLVASAVMDMFRELDAMESIRFSGQKEEGWYIEEAGAAMAEGNILYAGKYNMPDYELILSEGCSLAVENTMIYHSPEVIEKLEEFGIPVLVDYSSYENHPLGRVEWVKFYGALLGKEEEAQASFTVQSDIANQSMEDTEKKVVFFYITANGAVNVRKSSDYVPKMIELAGGHYIFENLGDENDKKSSVNMQMEEFYSAAKEADYLIYNSTIDGELLSVEDLLAKSELLGDFKAVKEGNVWCTTNDLYQQSMSIGVMIDDIHKMLTGGADQEEEMKYIYLLD